MPERHTLYEFVHPKELERGTFVKPTGKSFNSMAIDIFTVQNGKLATAHHVENWMTQFGKSRSSAREFRNIRDTAAM